jgi:uncharacterized membrane-anchored protein YhcB (DUF1043 family)
MTEEYNRKAMQLRNELEGHKLQKKNLRDQIVSHFFDDAFTLSHIK